MAVLPLHHSGNGREVAIVDDLFTFILLVSANVLSQLIIDWIKDTRNKDEGTNEKDKR